jgi:hypothetical protein
MKKTLTVEFIDTNNSMTKNCIKMLINGLEDKLISSGNNKVVIDASHVNFEKLHSLSTSLASTGFIKKISCHTEK